MVAGWVIIKSYLKFKTLCFKLQVKVALPLAIPAPVNQPIVPASAPQL